MVIDIPFNLGGLLHDARLVLWLLQDHANVAACAGLSGSELLSITFSINAGGAFSDT